MAWFHMCLIMLLFFLGRASLDACDRDTCPGGTATDPTTETVILLQRVTETTAMAAVGEEEDDDEPVEEATKLAFQLLDTDNSTDLTVFELEHGLFLHDISKVNVSMTSGDSSANPHADAEAIVAALDRDGTKTLSVAEFRGSTASASMLETRRTQNADASCNFVETYTVQRGGPIKCTGWPPSCSFRRRYSQTVHNQISNAVGCFRSGLTDFEFEAVKPCGKGPALSTPCSDLDSISTKLRDESAAGAEEWAARVIDRVAEEAGVFYKDPELAYNMEQAENTLAILTEVKDGYLTVLPDEGMANFLKDNNIKTPEDFTKTFKIKSKARQWKKLASVGLDVVGSLAGPAGVGLAVAGAYLDFHETADAQSAQALLAKQLYTEIMKEVKAMLMGSNADTSTRFFNEQKAAIKGWLKGFESEYKTVTQQLTVIRKSKMARSGLTQFLLLNSLMLDVGSTRFQWLKGAIIDFNCRLDDITHGCNHDSWVIPKADFSVTSVYKWGDYRKSKCVMLRNQLFMLVAPLISLHMSLIHTTSLLARGIGGMAGVLQNKLFDMAEEYKSWLDMFVQSTCTFQDKPQYAMQGEIRSCNLPGKIVLCTPSTCIRGGCKMVTGSSVWIKIVRMKEAMQNLLNKSPAYLARQLDKRKAAERKKEEEREMWEWMAQAMNKHNSRLLQTATNASSTSQHHAAAAVEHFEDAHGPLAREFTAICGGFSCLAGEVSDAQREALKGLSRRAVAELL